MFTGIVEGTGTVEKIIKKGTNQTFWIHSGLARDLKTDQSLSHNGVCLTVEEVLEGSYRVTAIKETLKKSNLGNWKKGDLINLERCVQMNGRLDGHIVQGHVDTTAVCVSKKELKGSWELTFRFPKKFSHLLIEKGSIAVNGISLTLFEVKKNAFKVAIIPYTYEHTNIKTLSGGDVVNLEFDIIGKYVAKMMSAGH